MVRQVPETLHPGELDPVFGPFGWQLERARSTYYAKATGFFFSSFLLFFFFLSLYLSLSFSLSPSFSLSVLAFKIFVLFSPFSGVLFCCPMCLCACVCVCVCLCVCLCVCVWFSLSFWIELPWLHKTGSCLLVDSPPPQQIFNKC